MNGVPGVGGFSRGFQAVAQLTLTAQRPVPATDWMPPGSETLLAAIAHPPRGGEPRPLAALVPEVLARYGLTAKPGAAPTIDVLA